MEPAQAQSVWDGGGTTDNWSDGLNWTSNTAPTSGVALQFGGTTRLNAFNNLTGTTAFTSLTFNTWGIDLAAGGPNRTGAAIRATLRDVFPHVLEVPAAGNLLFFAAEEPVVARRDAVEITAFDGPQTFTWLEVAQVAWPVAEVLVDDCNPVDAMDASLREAGRAGHRATMPAAVRAALVWE